MVFSQCSRPRQLPQRCERDRVQTLSRLNRCHPKKRDSFVLDFANNAEDIQKSFQRFYKSTILSRETDPDKLNNLLNEEGNAMHMAAEN